MKYSAALSVTKMMLRNSLLLWVLACILGNPCICTRELQHGYSRIQYGHRLDSRTLDTYGGVSFLDCVKECLVTTRCKSINYHKGANYCETNYEDKPSATNKFMKKSGWVYSERGDWPEALAGRCASYNCSLNQKCRHNKYSKDTLISCILSDCGIPEKYGVDVDNMQQGDAIALNRRMHVSCAEGFEKFGTGRLICRSSGEWDYQITCVDKKKKLDRSKDNSCGVWVGGKRDLEGFIWTESGRLLEYTNWKENEPNNSGRNEDCMEVKGDGEWNDVRCSKALPYICEKILI